MAEPKVVHSTFVIERSFTKPATTVFAALSGTRQGAAVVYR